MKFIKVEKPTKEEQEIKNLINFLKQKDEYELNGLKTTYIYSK